MSWRMLLEAVGALIDQVFGHAVNMKASSGSGECPRRSRVGSGSWGPFESGGDYRERWGCAKTGFAGFERVGVGTGHFCGETASDCCAVRRSEGSLFCAVRVR